MIRIKLTGRVPSKKNSKQIISRGGRMFLIPSSEHERWHLEKTRDLRAYIISIKNPIENAKIKLEFYPPDRRKADLTNKAESIMDLLVDNRILKDDNWFICGDINLKFGGVDKINPRVEIEITEI